MRCQSKIDASLPNTLGGFDQILIKGKMYECDLTPKIYDTMTFHLAASSYIVKCEDGKTRKYYAEHFIDIVEVRAEKLKELGI